MGEEKKRKERIQREKEREAEEKRKELEAKKAAAGEEDVMEIGEDGTFDVGGTSTEKKIPQPHRHRLLQWRRKKMMLQLRRKKISPHHLKEMVVLRISTNGLKLYKNLV